MSKAQKFIFVTLILFSLNLLATECPKNFSVNFESPKAKENLSGVKQKVSFKTNSKDGLYYHLIQTNVADKGQKKYLQSSGKIESDITSSYVWLGNEKEGKNSTFEIMILVSTKLISKEGKVTEWNEKLLTTNEICGKSSAQVTRTN